MNPFTSEVDPIERVSRDQPLPLSVNQGAYLIAESVRRAKGGLDSEPHLPWGLEFDGELDVDAVQRWLQGLFARHEVLRTAFPDLDRVSGRKQAELLEAFARFGYIPPSIAGASLLDSVTIPLTRLDDIPADRSVDGDPLVSEFIQKPFDRAVAPLMRAGVARCGVRRHLLLLVFHHLVIDAASLLIMRRDFEREYCARPTAPELRLQEPSVQYVDYAAWQQQVIDGPDAMAQIEGVCARYWDRFGGRLVTARDLWPHGAVEAPSETVVRIERAVDRAVLTAVRHAARSLRLTSCAVWLGCVVLALYRRTRRTPVVIWTYSANRARLEIECLLGWFANGWPVGVEVDLEEPANVLFARVQRAIWAVADHGEIPTSLLMRAMQRRIRPNTATGWADDYISFDHNLVMSAPTKLGPSLTMRDAPVHSTRRQRSVDLSVVEHEVDGTLSCRHGRGHSATVARELLDEIVRLVQMATDQPERRVRAVLDCAQK